MKKQHSHGDIDKLINTLKQDPTRFIVSECRNKFQIRILNSQLQFFGHKNDRAYHHLRRFIKNRCGYQIEVQ